MPDGKLMLWEKMVTESLREKSFVRADLDSSEAWCLHPNDHGLNFVIALPKIIERVEAGWYPPEQAGYYDLKLGTWMRHLGIRQRGARAQSVQQILENWENCIAKALRERQVPGHLESARLKFLVVGEGGGCWTVDMGKLERPVSIDEGPAQCTITVSANDLIDLINGETSLALAVKHRWLKVNENAKVFWNFTAFLSSQGALI
jgi:hypothetical protein